MAEPGPRRRRPIRDLGLLDALDRTPRRPYAGAVWRSVRQGRDPLACARSGGRWDDGGFDVLYTSETRQAALAERRFHLHQGQPIPPSKVRYELFELRVALEAVVELDPARLAALGLDMARYGQLSNVEREQEYPRSQEIAEACAFLGADGLRAPSARDQTAMNLIVFCDQETRIETPVVRNHGPVDFDR